MVARGLDKSLSIEQREHILNSFITVCGEDIGQGVVEALGLVCHSNSDLHNLHSSSMINLDHFQNITGDFAAELYLEYQ